ncbi:MAG: sigma 54-interacting transcriptional regulator [Rhodospirillales bacterium]|nr:sigma 54-interacting transcriptional regulator [Rhodospirillales bacterium]
MDANNAMKTSLSLVSMYEIRKIPTSTVDLQAQRRGVLNLLASYMEMQRGIVAITDGKGSLRILAAAGLSSSAVNDGAADMPAEIAARIVAGQAPFVTENVADDPLLAEYVRVPSVLEDETVSFIAGPVKTPSTVRLLAVARVRRRHVLVSIGEDIRFLTMVANLIAQTVRLHEGMNPAEREPDAEFADLYVPSRAAAADAEYRLDNVIGASRPMQEVFAQVHLTSLTRSTVVPAAKAAPARKPSPGRCIRPEPTPATVRQGQPRRRTPRTPCSSPNCYPGHEKGAFTGATRQRKGRFRLPTAARCLSTIEGRRVSRRSRRTSRVPQEREFERVGGKSTIQSTSAWSAPPTAT